MDNQYEINIEMKEFPNIKSILNKQINKTNLKKKTVKFNEDISYRQYIKSSITGSLF